MATAGARFPICPGGARTVILTLLILNARRRLS